MADRRFGNAHNPKAHGTSTKECPKSGIDWPVVRVACQNYASNDPMGNTGVALFDEKYRVVAVESQCLVIRGVRSGKVLTIVNPDPETPLSPIDYPPGKLIALSDPSAAPAN